MRGGRAVLLVEDERLLLHALTRILVSLGHEVLQAETAEQALALVDETGQCPPLLITDIGLRGLDGQALAVKLRERCPGLSVLLMTGCVDAETLHRMGQGQKRTGVLAKPFSRDDLARAVQGLLAEHGGSNA